MHLEVDTDTAVHYSSNKRDKDTFKNLSVLSFLMFKVSRIHALGAFLSTHRHKRGGEGRKEHDHGFTTVLAWRGSWPSDGSGLRDVYLCGGRTVDYWRGSRPHALYTITVVITAALESGLPFTL